MSTNKHAQIRYRALDKCFGNHSKRYYMEDLIKACNNAIEDAYGVMDGVKKRQIFEDIKFMESEQGFSIKLDRIADGHKKYYRYNDKNFSILKKTISDNEVLQIKKVLHTLSKFKGLPKFEWISETIARLDSGLGLSENENNTIEFDQNFYLKGLEFISPIYEAIASQQTISINYKSFKFNQKQTFVVHPYFLKQYNNRWFMFGLNNLSKRIVNLALDRIVTVNNTKEKYLPNTE
ncbi:MAG: helix-turn-helix transcriptional regulator, partial [Bacteroidia bacterium]